MLSEMETSLGYFTGKEIAREQFQSVGDWISEEKSASPERKALLVDENEDILAESLYLSLGHCILPSSPKLNIYVVY